MDRIERLLPGAGRVRGGDGRRHRPGAGAAAEARPDLGLLRIASRLRSFRDDALLRAAADYFEAAGIRIVAPTDCSGRSSPRRVTSPARRSTPRRSRTSLLGEEVATLLGRADVGQTVVVKNGHVLALEAVEGTDETASAVAPSSEARARWW